MDVGPLGERGTDGSQSRIGDATRRKDEPTGGEIDVSEVRHGFGRHRYLMN
ncbi:hypothetical protein IM816_11815 [Luteibacter flocculans]|uniref:Uncharacterized protein n=1 Tax=Luteibacter flocculans TaxID=2780091 RepID=A0ABY4T332_9GAMM|nr:hypothetical protein [Luteibacter flocculans]URL57324.1 hypothetical protein IM816_11815 [Luteibacter flocculans]